MLHAVDDLMNAASEMASIGPFSAGVDPAPGIDQAYAASKMFCAALRAGEPYDDFRRDLVGIIPATVPKPMCTITAAVLVASAPGTVRDEPKLHSLAFSPVDGTGDSKRSPSTALLSTPAPPPSQPPRRGPVLHRDDREADDLRVASSRSTPGFIEAARRLLPPSAAAPMPSASTRKSSSPDPAAAAGMITIRLGDPRLHKLFGEPDAAKEEDVKKDQAVAPSITCGPFAVHMSSRDELNFYLKCALAASLKRPELLCGAGLDIDVMSECAGAGVDDDDSLCCTYVLDDCPRLVAYVLSCVDAARGYEDEWAPKRENLRRALVLERLKRSA
jgi:hypothetical protein